MLDFLGARYYNHTQTCPFSGKNGRINMVAYRCKHHPFCKGRIKFLSTALGFKEPDLTEIVGFVLHHNLCEFTESNQQLEEFKKSKYYKKAENTSTSNEETSTNTSTSFYDDDNLEQQKDQDYCPVCKKKFDNTPMIACDICDNWYHLRCVVLDVLPSKNEEWYCEMCLQNPTEIEQLKEKANKSDDKVETEYLERGTLALNRFLQYVIDCPITDEEKKLVTESFKNCRDKFQIVLHKLGLESEPSKSSNSVAPKRSKETDLVKKFDIVKERLNNLNVHIQSIIDFCNSSDKIENDENLVKEPMEKESFREERSNSMMMANVNNEPSTSNTLQNSATKDSSELETVCDFKFNDECDKMTSSSDTSSRGIKRELSDSMKRDTKSLTKSNDHNSKAQRVKDTVDDDCILID